LFLASEALTEPRPQILKRAGFVAKRRLLAIVTSSTE
jgi:hypothetical protein